MTENFPGAQPNTAGAGAEAGVEPTTAAEPNQPAEAGQTAQPSQTVQPGQTAQPHIAQPSETSADPAIAPSAETSPEPGQPGHAGQEAFAEANPWSASGQTYYSPPASHYQTAGGYGGYPPPSGPPAQQTMVGQPPAGGPPRRRRGALIAGIAVLALLVGGGAGALGGYLVAGNNNASGSSVNALDQVGPNAAPASSTPSPSSGTVQSVAAAVLPAVVEVSVQYQTNQGLGGDTGSGIVITSDGDILTNNHVIADGVTNNGQIQVIFQSGKTVNATVVGRDPTADVAVIKAQGASGLTTAQLGNSDGLQVGQQVVAIGAPYGLSGTVTSGIVSALRRPTSAGDSNSANNQDTVMDAIQTDAAINPGNSGGPLVNMQGQVIGINSAIYSSGGSSSSQGGNVGIGFAIPINQAQRLAQDIVTTGHSTQTYLGVSVEDSVSSMAGGSAAQNQQYQSELEQAGLTNGALIHTVQAGGPGDKAGLKTGEVVVKASANGVTRLITSADGLVAAVRAAAPGNQMTLTLSNGSTVTVTLGGQPVTAN
ncbi:MAG TPA: trypsin-like peptidase domain-containing protein [Pseudonocardiaceae bacterium]|jgi:putative serine protease PepD|nr:trypsin-like peptidase domain-containing protein [Pseudonocardiaceae bacterium]